MTRRTIMRASGMGANKVGKLATAGFIASSCAILWGFLKISTIFTWKITKWTFIVMAKLFKWTGKGIAKFTKWSFRGITKLAHKIRNSESNLLDET